MAHEIDFSVFVGDLAYEVDDATLEATFRTYYSSVKQAKVMLDPTTNRSRGFGFVRFTNEAERDRAITEMNGVFIGSKQIRVSLATRKTPPGVTTTVASPGHPGTQLIQASTGAPAAPAAGVPPPVAAGAGPGAGVAGSTGGQSTSTVSTATATAGSAGGRQTDVPSDPALNPNNTTLFIGGLSANVSEAELHCAFAQCGEIVYTKIPPGKGCGFVQFVNRQSAEYALEHMNGFPLAGMPIRISWGKSSRPPGGVYTPSTVPPSAAAHGGMHAYGAYTYGAYGADPYAMYGGAYGMQAAYDPYTGATYATAGYGMDPYAGYQGYGVAVPGGPGMAASAAASAAHAAHGGPAPGTPGAIQPMMYDPMAAVSVDKMNMAYMHRHVPVMTGAYVRVPIMPAAAMGGQQPM